MKTYPLESISIKAATKKQFALVDTITRHFNGYAILSQGDLGVHPSGNRPVSTQKAEQVIADFFNQENAMLVRGAGTMAIRLALSSMVEPGDTILIHAAPIYPTTETTIKMLGLKTEKVDFNQKKEVEEALKTTKAKVAIVQYTRQKSDDSYNMGEIVSLLAEKLKVITDDNYAVMKVPKIGAEYGATVSCFSTFKLLGPEGIGCIVGNSEVIQAIRKENYSGGLQVQGHEALQVLRGLIYAPVALAIEAEVIDEIYDRLQKKEVHGIKNVMIASAQSKVILVELEDVPAPLVLKYAEQLGAAPHPVGAESKYEFVPMFYRVSGTFSRENPQYKDSMIRINPLRAGADTVLRILEQAIISAREDGL